MTKQERATRSAIARYLRQQGYVTYAGLLLQVDLNFHNPPGAPFAASMSPKTGTIYLNPTITDKQAVSTLIRHEILHNFLEHEIRLLKHTASKAGLDYDVLDEISLKDLERQLYSSDTFNIAADYEISNRGYTDADKDIQRRIGEFGDLYEKAVRSNPMLNREDLKGLVTEDEHPDWVYDSVEDMYDKLTREIEKDKQQLENEDPDVIVGIIDPNNPTAFYDPQTNTIYAYDDSK